MALTGTSIKISEVVDMAKRAYDRATRDKHYAGILILSKFYHPSQPTYERALVQYNRYVDEKEGWK